MKLDVVSEKGARTLNPARAITKRRMQPREWHLPEPEPFGLCVESIGEAGA